MVRIDFARFAALTSMLAAACASGTKAREPAPIVASAPTTVEVPDAGTTEAEPAPDATVEVAAPSGEGSFSSEGDMATEGDPLGPSAETGAVIGATPNPSDMLRVIRANVGKFRACYQNELKSDPAFTAKVTVKMVIGTSGALTSASLGKSSGRASFDACLLGVAKRMVFAPPANGPVNVAYPMAFAAP